MLHRPALQVGNACKTFCCIAGLSSAVKTAPNSFPCSQLFLVSRLRFLQARVLYGFNVALWRLMRVELRKSVMS
jgi:hypothetical protein